jgi:signal transduction histidine kinase
MLEEHDIESAIRQILRPRIGSTQLVVRFNVSRNRISDNTAYALFRIIRELGSNAVRHGKATVIKVVGAIERDVLLISVSDNGCGFDPENRPGIAEGHFGLQGITERVRHLNGRLEIRSAPGQGTRVRIELKTHTPTMKKECSV